MRSRLVVLVPLVAIVTIAFLLRVVGEWANVFQPEGVYFLGADSYYHMRIADWMAANPGRVMTFDAYAAYPSGLPVGYRPMLSAIVVATSYLVSWGMPDVATLDVVGALVPPVIGALAIIPVYLLGRHVFNSRLVGLVGAGLVAVLPTEFLHRSLLGFTDHHILETFWSAWIVLFLVLAVQRGWRWGLAAGVGQALLTFSWQGSMYLMAIVVLWCVLSFFYRHIRGQETTPVLASFAAYAGAAALLSVPFLLYYGAARLEYASHLMLVGVPGILYLYGRVFPKGRKGAVVLAGLAVGSVTGVALIASHSTTLMAILLALRQQLLAVFWGYRSTILEAQPLSFGNAWTLYGVAGLITLVGLYLAIRNGRSATFVIWSVVMLVAAIGQRRWGYYAVIPVGLLTAYGIQQAAGWFATTARPSFVFAACLLIVIASAPYIAGVMRVPPDLDGDTRAAAEWLRDNTPEQFANTAYLDAEQRGHTADYAILSWWDYGHFIVRIGQRVPVSSPTWQDEPAQWFFAAQSVEEAEGRIEGFNVRYIVIHRDMVTTKFYAVVHKLRHGIIDGWEEMLPNSMAYRLYHSRGWGPYRLVFVSERVKVFEVVPPPTS